MYKWWCQGEWVYTYVLFGVCVCTCTNIPVIDGVDWESYNTLPLALHTVIMKGRTLLLWHHQSHPDEKEGGPTSSFLSSYWDTEKLNGLSKASQWVAFVSLACARPSARSRTEVRSLGLQTGTFFHRASHYQCWHNPSELGSWKSAEEKWTLPSQAGVSTSETKLVILTQMANYLLAALYESLIPVIGL